MKDSDKILLDGLRSTVASDVPADHWEMVVKAVEDAGDVRLIDGYAATIVLGAIEKAKKKKKNKVQTVMGEFKEGKLESSSGKKVTNPKQAIAIALSEQRRAKKKVAKAEEAPAENIEKASFASRSEAGRYAAEQRWKNQRAGGAQAAKDDARLRRVFMRWMDDDGPQTSAKDLQAMIDAKILKPEQLNNYDRALLGLPPQAKRMPLDSKQTGMEPAGNKEPFLDLTDIDPQGKLETNKPAASRDRERTRALADIEANQAQIGKLYQQQANLGAGEEARMQQIQSVIDRLEQMDRNLRSKYEQAGYGTSPRLATNGAVGRTKG